MTRPHVLIVGAGGLFGSRLAHLLARSRRYRLSLGGRDEGKIQGLLLGLSEMDRGAGHNFVALDRTTTTAEQLRGIGCAVVVDCAGPFQGSGTTLIEAAIGAGCHYVDLADARAFVADIQRFDAPARAARVAVISGASTTPGLTHAVIDHLTGGWRAVDTVDIAIVPGNRTPKGKSVIAAILSWVGQKVRIFREGTWQEARGWGETQWVKLEGLEPRRAAIAEVPDLDVLVDRYKPRVRASFRAGMELGILHRLIGLSGKLVQWRLLPSAALLSGIGYRVAMALDKRGTDTGGMLIEVSGQDQDGQGKLSRFTLRALDGDGPYVPAVPAAAAVDALLAGRLHFRGASQAGGLLDFEAMRPWFEGFAIETAVSHYRKVVPLYKRVMGPAFADLPEVTRELHRGRPAIVARGEAVVERPANFLAALMARAFGMPQPNPRVPLTVIIEAREGREYWTRFFGSSPRPLRSVMAKGEGAVIEESFGPVTIGMTLVGRADGLDMKRGYGRMFGVPLPSFLLPKIRAQEGVDAERRHTFDVDITLPVLGRLVAYRGWLGV